MQLPGFAANVSLYGTRQSYRGIAGLVTDSGVQPQQPKGCGKCYIHSDGNCAKDCRFPGGDVVVHPCAASACACGPCICTKDCSGVRVPC